MSLLWFLINSIHPWWIQVFIYFKDKKMENFADSKYLKTNEICTHPNLAQKAYIIYYSEVCKKVQRCKRGINPSSVPCAAKQTPALMKTCITVIHLNITKIQKLHIYISKHISKYNYIKKALIMIHKQLYQKSIHRHIYQYKYHDSKQKFLASVFIYNKIHF